MWPLLWDRLDRLGWSWGEFKLGGSHVKAHIAPWASDSVHANKRSLDEHKKGRDYFFETGDVVVYLKKYGVRTGPAEVSSSLSTLDSKRRGKGTSCFVC